MAVYYINQKNLSFHIKGSLDCVSFLAVMNKASCHFCICSHISVLLITRIYLLGHSISIASISIDNAKLFYEVLVPMYIPTNSV